MAKLSHEYSDDQIDAGVGLDGISESDLISVLRARDVSYAAELLSLIDRTKYVTEQREANAALLAQYVVMDVSNAEKPKKELRGAGTLAEVMGVEKAERHIAETEAREAVNLSIAIERGYGPSSWGVGGSRYPSGGWQHIRSQEWND